MAKYFTDDEVKGLDPRLVLLLDQMRASAGIPIVITCGLRTSEKNDSLVEENKGAVLTGAVKDSAHLKGLAADLQCPDSATRFILVKAAYAVGFRRIEAATAHVHVDIDESLPQNVLFLGISK